MWANVGEGEGPLGFRKLGAPLTGCVFAAGRLLLLHSVCAVLFHAVLVTRVAQWNVATVSVEGVTRVIAAKSRGRAAAWQ